MNLVSDTFWQKCGCMYRSKAVTAWRYSSFPCLPCSWNLARQRLLACCSLAFRYCSCVCSLLACFSPQSMLSCWMMACCSIDLLSFSSTWSCRQQLRASAGRLCLPFSFYAASARWLLCWASLQPHLQQMSLAKAPHWHFSHFLPWLWAWLLCLQMHFTPALGTYSQLLQGQPRVAQCSALARQAWLSKRWPQKQLWRFWMSRHSLPCGLSSWQLQSCIFSAGCRPAFANYLLTLPRLRKLRLLPSIPSSYILNRTTKAQASQSITALSACRRAIQRDKQRCLWAQALSLQFGVILIIDSNRSASCQW